MKFWLIMAVDLLTNLDGSKGRKILLFRRGTGCDVIIFGVL